ncbi:hypothetical protein GWK47_025157 [Chionoecetes opilio]|uniref:Uncharacterized protein n=1 Tax=Chionoecetes opilio TaxID=41210 RepID=A0A8J4XKJ3_CHIOP|nr:hypothetical protein GWK47_025157 [Chionoecetes opilio]
MAQFFEMEDTMTFCSDINGLLKELGIDRPSYGHWACSVGSPSYHVLTATRQRPPHPQCGPFFHSPGKSALAAKNALIFGEKSAGPHTCSPSTPAVCEREESEKAHSTVDPCMHHPSLLSLLKTLLWR